ncbi:hypothetical protein KEM55_008656 [Ascosphaera atra]|nr:hypothetical protein KEM55_008656 [Ascosphaera atra]
MSLLLQPLPPRLTHLSSMNSLNPASPNQAHQTKSPPPFPSNHIPATLTRLPSMSSTTSQASMSTRGM